MPPNRIPQSYGRVVTVGRWLAIVLSSAVLMIGQAAWGQTPEPTPIRSRSIEVHYRLAEGDHTSKVELWYTRDRGATWQRYGQDEDGASPLVFSAPAEGLYGLTLAARSGNDTPAPPKANEIPQRWIFVDYNPPLVQWDAAEADDAFAAKRTVHLRWTAYDDHLGSRPVSLAFQSSVDGKWQIINAALPNSGRYDWTVPPEANAQVSLKLVVSDLGGHSVERIYGPVAVERWSQVATIGAATTRPAAVAATRPASDSVAPVMAAGPPVSPDMEMRLKAQDLHQQGAWHLRNGRYAVAAERFREALEADPELLAAQCDLAGIYYLQQNYAKSLELYNGILARDAKYVPALRGVALAYGSSRQYPQTRDALKRLLTIQDKDAQAWFDLGDASFMMSDPAAARECWGRAASVDPSAEKVIAKAKGRLESYGTAAAEAAATGSR